MADTSENIDQPLGPRATKIRERLRNQEQE